MAARGSDKPALGARDFSCDWIVPLAEPYLRGYSPRFRRDKLLVGYRFLAPNPSSSRGKARAAKGLNSIAPRAGFFLGYLKHAPPECIVFCFVEPRGSRFHRRIVSAPESLMRRTAEYVRWLTHRPPRFEFFADKEVALVRHVSMREWPEGKIEHFSGNFFVETLAWLVRSALVRRLPEELTLASQMTDGKPERNLKVRRRRITQKIMDLRYGRKST